MLQFFFKPPIIHLQLQSRRLMPSIALLSIPVLNFHNCDQKIVAVDDKGSFNNCIPSSSFNQEPKLVIIIGRRLLAQV